MFTCLKTITDRRQHYNSYGVHRENRLARFKNKIVGDEPKKKKTKKRKKCNIRIIYDGEQGRKGGKERDRRK